MTLIAWVGWAGIYVTAGAMLGALGPYRVSDWQWWAWMAPVCLFSGALRSQLHRSKNNE